MKKLLFSILALMMILAIPTSFASSTNITTLTVVDQVTKSQIQNAVIEVSEESGKIVGRYITDLTGTYNLQNLPRGNYKATAVILPVGYKAMNPTSFIVKNGSVQTVALMAQKLNGVVVRKVDSVTKKPIQNIKLMLLDDNKNPIKSLMTDYNGQAVFEHQKDGIYYIREVATVSAYKPDINDYKIQLSNNQDAHLEMFSHAISGKIAILTRATQTNYYDTTQAGDVLPGAVYGIFDPKTNQLLTQIRSGNNGWAITTLPIGQYIVKQLQSRYGYAPSTQERLIHIKRENIIMSIDMLNDPLNLEVKIQSSGPSFILDGVKGTYIISTIMNRSNADLKSFYVEYVLPKNILKPISLTTPTFNQNKFFNVVAITNKREILVRSNVNAIESSMIDLSGAVLNLERGETIQSLRLTWNAVPAGFVQQSDMKLDVVALAAPDNPTSSYVVKTNVGGLVNNDWVTNQSVITTQVRTYK